MNISDLKKYLSNLPSYYDNFELIIRDIDTEQGSAYDTPIIMLMPDEENECLCIMDKYSSDIVSDMITENY